MIDQHLQVSAASGKGQKKDTSNNKREKEGAANKAYAFHKKQVSRP